MTTEINQINKYIKEKITTNSSLFKTTSHQLINHRYTLLMFFTILIIAVILVAVMVILPYTSGLTKIEIDRSHHQSLKKSSQESKPPQQQQQQYYGYVPPDEIQDLDDQANQQHQSLKDRAHLLKERLQVTADHIPLKIKLNKLDSGSTASGNSSGLRHRKREKLDLDNNPNTYDYDIDELIAEENDLARKEQQQEFYKDQIIGKEREEMV